METQLKTSTTSPATKDAKPTVVQFNIDEQCPIQCVTVYNDRAEVTRQLKHHFDTEGAYDLVLEGFSPSVDLKSLHISGGTGKACTILEVSYQTRHENPAKNVDSTPLAQLQTNCDDVQADIDQHQRELERLVKQRTWLDGRASKLMNQDGPVGTIDLDAMQQFIEFYHKTLLKLDDAKTSEETEIKRLTKQREGLLSKIREHGVYAQASRQKAKREVTVTVHISSSNTDVSLEVAYLISGCLWDASYDVRISSAEATRQKTQLTYYGIIVNKSQENWTNAQLSLSTATPSLGGAPPKLATWKIGYETFRYDNVGRNSCMTFGYDGSSMIEEKRSVISTRAKTSLSSNEIIEEGIADGEISNVLNVLASRTEASMSSTSFAIPRRSTVNADGKPHKVTIGVLDLTSIFTHVVVPKLSPYTYLKASTTNTSDKQLLSGPASVFMDNNFITHSTIENIFSGDTFDLPLGTDASIRVEYKPVKKVSDVQGMISKVNFESIRHETRLVNTKSSAVIVHVFDQVPLSSDEKIKVKLIQPDLRAKEQHANYTVAMNDSNNLDWKCLLQPKGECRLQLEYTLEWPKDKRVAFKQV